MWKRMNNLIRKINASMMNVIKTRKMKRTDRTFSSGGINNDYNAYNN